MRIGTGFPLPRERNLILALLLGLSLASWIVLIRQSADGEGEMMGMTMGMNPPLFIALWVVMMVAVMFPTAAPMILTFARIHESRRRQGHSFVPTWLFITAYLAVWSLAGVVAYGAAYSAEMAGQASPWISGNAGRIGGALLVLAGMYQLTPLKHVCLSRCRSPLTFVMTSWRDGNSGALRMGIEHGIFCMGCCWLLFLILLPLGVMNVGAMAAITLLIFAEKSLPLGHGVSMAAAAALAVLGAAVIWMPELLPTYMSASAAGGM